MKDLVDRLYSEGNLSDDELIVLLDPSIEVPLLHEAADRKRRQIYGDVVFLRGLIELTNYCRNDCFYCGIRRSNASLKRYRLDLETILKCCSEGYAWGYRTFVLQGGEDGYYTDERLLDIVSSIHSSFPDCAITLSLGERSFDSYRRLREAGATRYLLRHETADREHYEKIHPHSMSWENRVRCLRALKDLGYQVGSGFMVGSPFQTDANIVKDIRFLQELDPDMIGIGPFLHHKDTPFSIYPNGSLIKTLRLLSILRLMMPHVLLPATTALATLSPNGREIGLKSGANVVMPNLSPCALRKLYALYDNKIGTGEEAAEGLHKLEKCVNCAGYSIAVDRGDVRR